MKFATSAAAALAVLPYALATPVDPDSTLSQRQPEIIPEIWERAIDTRDFETREAEADAEADGWSTHDLEKRRGGGGGGRGGGSSSSGSSSSGSSSSGSSSSGSRGGSTGSSGSTGRGGSTSSSSSSSPSYGGGRYYGGGSTSAYSAGARSPIGGITPFLIGGSLLGLGTAALLWPPNVYNYPWHTRYNYRSGNGTNRTTTNTRRQDNGNGTVSLPVICLCDPDLSCGCDDNGNSTYFDQFLGPGNTTNNATLVTIQNVNSTDTVVVNGTLPNGTDDSDDGTDDTSGARMLHVQAGGYTVMSAAMVASLWLL